MEVHAPHHPLNSWRDFFIHIATIVVGLLIAIGLEQMVEWIHHRHIVHEARENIRREMELNQETAKKDLDYLSQDADLMKANTVKARTLRDDPKSLEHGEFKSSFSWDSFKRSAWLSARDSGALTYMPVDEVQGYDDVYEQQDRVNTEAVTTFTRQIELVAPFVMEASPDKIRPEDVHSLMRDSAVAYLRLNTLHQIVEALDQQYVETLKQ